MIDARVIGVTFPDIAPSWTRRLRSALPEEIGRCGGTFGDDTVAAAMIDRLVQHAEVNAPKGDSTGSRTAARGAA